MTLWATPCTIVRRTNSEDVDELGNAVNTEAETETVCDLQQRQRDEPETAGELSVTTWDIFFPAGTEIDTGDSVIVGGYVYEMLGDPWDANQGSAAVNHVAATVRRTEEVVVS